MKKVCALILLSMLLTVSSFSQQNPKEIQKLLKSYEKAIQQYDNGFDTVYISINQQIEQQKDDPASLAVWHSCMAQLLNSYYEQNRYKILDRTTVVGETNSDYKTWDVQTLVQKIVWHYFKSIENEDALKAIPIADYACLLDSLTAVEYRPTLYDFLAFRALDYLNTTIYQLPIPIVPFNINHEIHWSDNQNFANSTLTSDDELSFSFLSLKIMQRLTLLHLNDIDSRALLDVTIRRYSYLNEHSTMENAWALIMKQLEKLEQDYQGKTGYEMVAFAIGEYYQHRGEQYDKNTHPEYKNDWVTAVEWYQKAIATAPKSIEANKARLAIQSIENEMVNIVSKQKTSPQQTQFVTLEYKNCEHIFLRVIPISEVERDKFFSSDKEKYSYLIKKKYIFDTDIAVPNEHNYREASGHFQLPALAMGHYYILVSNAPLTEQNNKGFSLTSLQVTNINAAYRNNDKGNGIEFFVFDRISGKALPGATIRVEGYDSYNKNTKPNAIEMLICDKDGKCTYNITQDRKYITAYAIWNKEKYCVCDKYVYFNANGSKNYHRKTDYLFTDRNIYRPGQTVYCKGITVEKTESKGNTVDMQVVQNEVNKLELFDANNTKIAEITDVTNEFGSFSASFELPTTTLTGDFHISSKYGNTYFKVEEYKRPTFEVTFDQTKEEFKLNQNIGIDGNVMAYAGYGVGEASVNYRVVRKASFPWWRHSWWRPNSRGQEIAHGEVKSDVDGHFHIDFMASEDNESQRFNPLYNFEVTVVVTDITGETHSAATHIMISKNALLIDASIPESVPLTHQNQFAVKITNLAGEVQNGNLHYTIESLKTPDVYKYVCPTADYYLSDSEKLVKSLPYLDFLQEQNKENWDVLKTIAQGDFKSNGKNSFSIPDLKNYAEGYYKIRFSTYDKEQNEITKEQYFLIFDEKSKKCAAYEPLWIQTNGKTSAEVGESIHISLGTYFKNARIFVEIISNDQVIDSKWINSNQGNTEFNYEVKERDLGKLIFHAFVTQNNNQYEESLTFTVPYSHQKIDFDFLTFRDKTLPGSQEQYQIRLKNKDGEKVMAELLCSMYDASLDALYHKHDLNTNIHRWEKITYEYELRNCSTEFLHKWYQKAETKNHERFSTTRLYPNLLWKITPHSTRMLYKSMGANKAYAFEESLEADFDNAEEVVLNIVEDNLSIETGAIKIEDDVAIVEETNAGGQETKTLENSIRSNFNETAFFFPHLQTDAEGNILISFTIPDALTRWRLQGFAHNAELMSGYFEKIVVTQKPLMVIPNMPRFFREGDTLVLSAKVVNLDSVKQSGTAKITFTNPLDGQKVELTPSGCEQAFSVEPGQSQEVHFNIVVPLGLGAVTYRIEAKNNQTPSFADGEENTIPVFTNRILVTESLPLHISGKGSKVFNFNKLQNYLSNPNGTLTTQSLTLEFTPNPIWYAIQSIPYLMEYPYECNEQVFSRYYANSLAANIINKHPKIKTVFDTWLHQDIDAFCSQLDKNQELKSVILAETPWVLDAQNENARKQNIALLFDFNQMAKEEKSAIDKLEKTQNSDGGWSWFAGGESSSYITEHIVAGCGHLQALGIKYGLSEASMSKAIRFIDQKAKENYEKWYKKDKTNCSVTDIHYLYARSFFKQKINASCEESYNYFYSNLKKNWKKQSIYGQAMTALICYRKGDIQLASDIVAQIKSMAQYDEEMGMFWKKEGYGYFWYEAPIERQAMLIEAFNTITKDQESVEKMQLWLLKQKQTQNWPTTKSTTEAIYALLLNNNQLENTEGVKLRVGDWQYTEGDGTMAAEAGSGYVKKVWKGAEVNAQMGTVSIEKNSAGPAWGGLYWQYLENMDKVSSSDDKNLVISKKLYKVEYNERGEVLLPITEESPLKVGDKVRVRTEIRSDRDMEYVHLKDMRAAAFEPENVLSQYKYQDGLWYYEATGDAATNFFIDYLPKGTYVFEYTLIATMAGTYSNGITSIQCMYAPEFTSHSAGERVKIK